MRWISDNESVRNGEPSVLAIAETLVAMGISFWIAHHFDTALHILIGACVAPLMLLRTDASAALGLRMIDKPSTWHKKFVGPIRNLVQLLVVASSVPIRVLATAIASIQDKWAMASAISSNWRSVVFALDVRTSPELMPTPDDETRLESSGTSVRPMSIYGFLATSWRESVARPGAIARLDARYRLWSRARSVVTELFRCTILVPFVCVPPIIYRFSLESTAIVSFPLLWVLGAVASSTQPIEARLRLFEKSDIFRIVRVLSVVAVFGFATKLWFWHEVVIAAGTWNESIGGRILTIHVAPGVLEWWQLAIVVNSMIAIGLWLYVRSCLRHIDVGVPRTEATVASVFGWTLLVRRILTSYTILCIGYLYATEARVWELPPLGGKPFPWM